jgi:hypothetical protein
MPGPISPGGADNVNVAVHAVIDPTTNKQTPGNTLFSGHRQNHQDETIRTNSMARSGMMAVSVGGPYMIGGTFNVTVLSSTEVNVPTMISPDTATSVSDPIKP